MAEGGNWLAEAVVSFLSGPLYINPVMEYVDQHCLIFTPDEENKLEYTPIHNKFKDLVDQLLTAFIGELGVAPQEFYDVIAAQHDSDKLTGFVVQTILTVDDFLLFKAMMVKRNIDLTNQVLAAVDAMREIAGGAELDGAPDLSPEEEAKMLEEALHLSQLLNADEEQTHRLRQLMRALQIEDEDIAMAMAIANSLRDQTRMEGELAELNQAVALSVALAEAGIGAPASAGGASASSAPVSAPALDPLAPLNIGPNTAAEKMAAVAAAAEASARALSVQVVTSGLGAGSGADSAAKRMADLSVSGGASKAAAGSGAGAGAGAGLAPIAPGLRQPGAGRLAPDSVTLDGPLKPSEDVPSANQVIAAALKDLAAAGEAGPKAGNVRKAAGYKGDGPGTADLAAVRQAAQQAAETQRAMMQRKGPTSDASQQWLNDQKLKLVAQKKAEREAETAAYKKEQAGAPGARSVAPTPTQVRSDAELEAKRAALRNKLAQKFKEDLVKGSA